MSIGRTRRPRVRGDRPWYVLWPSGLASSYWLAASAVLTWVVLGAIARQDRPVSILDRLSELGVVLMVLLAAASVLWHLRHRGKGQRRS